MKQTKLFALSSAFALAASVACAGVLDSYTFESAVNAENADTTVITAGTKDNADAISKWALQNKDGGAGSVETPATLVAYSDGEGGVAKPTKTTAISGGTNTKFLNLSTDGDRLFRNIKADGTAQAIDAAGIFIDTLVQFSVTEDTPPALATDGQDKLAIWLQGNEEAGTKTLCVKASTIRYVDDAWVLTPTTFALDATVEPDTWYRLTVKSIANVFQSESGVRIAAFKIYIDGVEASSTSNACGLTDEQIATMTSTEVAIATSEQITALKSGALFPSLVESVSTLTAVGFQGEGKVDDYVVSTDNPFVTPFDFTLSFPANSSVTYTIGGKEQTVTDTTTGSATLNNIIPGTLITMTVTVGSGRKTVSVTAGDETKTLDVGSVNYSWYFNQNVQGTESDPILVASVDDLTALKNMVADGISTTGLYFKQTAEAIILENFAGIGDRYSSGSVEKAFAGVYDGNNKTITVNSLVAGKYAGIFNTLKGTKTNPATLKKLVVNFDNVSYENVEGENGCATVGTAENYVIIDNVTANGSITSTHNSAGFIALVQGNVTFINCTNTCTITGGTNVGSFIGRYDTVGSNLILQGTNKAQANLAAVGDGAAPALSFATVADGVATFATPVAGRSYKVMASGATVTLANIGDTITLDTTLATATVGTSAADAHVESADGVYRVVADRATVKVSVSAADGTTITGVEAGTATQGAKISFTVEVDNAYKADTLVVKNGDTPLTADGEGKYSITVGTADIAITTSVEAKAQVAVSVKAATGTTVTEVTGVTDGKALEGDTISFKVTVASGYDASTLVVKNGDTPLTADQGTYTIEVGTTAIAITTTVDVAKTPSYVPSGKEEVYNSWAAANKDALDKATPVVAAEAFALGCAPTADALATAKAAFKVTITMVNGVPQVSCPQGYNITPVIMSSDTVNGTYTEGTSGKFFKAVITIPNY